jgi:hypothetical protein
MASPWLAAAAKLTGLSVTTTIWRVPSSNLFSTAYRRSQPRLLGVRIKPVRGLSFCSALRSFR